MICYGEAERVWSPVRCGPALLRLSGEFDLCNADRLGAALSEITAGAPDEVVIDLSELVFLDAAAAREIAIARRRLPPRQCSIVLRSPRPVVRKILELTDLDGPCIIENSPIPRDGDPR
jgi:anti-anti-sigma factor